ncbi:MAG: hypothetical protein ACLP6E_01355 [Acidimicrobiales bacterium]
MVEDPSAWDSFAASSRWIEPGERILWRGRPDPKVIFASEDSFLLPISVVWTAGVTLILVSGLRSGGPQRYINLIGVPLVVIGIYALIGRFFVKAWTRRRTRYAITDRRAVEVTKRGLAVKEAPVGTSMKVRRRRDGRHGSALWLLGQTDANNQRRSSTFSSNSMNSEFLRGTYWPGPNRSLPKAVAFFDVDGVDVVTVARHAGFPVADRPPGESMLRLRNLLWPTSLEARRGRSEERQLYPGSKTHVRGARQWVRSGFFRQPYALWSPLLPEEVYRRLSQNLVVPSRNPLSSLAPGSFGFPGLSDPIYEGTVSGPYIRLSCRGSLMRSNSWRKTFEGGIAANGPGCWLTGTVGPASSVAVFCSIWFGGVSLFFIGGLGGFISDAVTGHGYALLPFVLIPMAMLGFFFVLIEVATRSAASEWRSMDGWLRSLLEVPDSPGR